MEASFVAIDEDGNKINQIGTIAWDGKDHATEKPGITVAITLVNDQTQSATVKENGAVIDSGQVTLLKDGKTMTQTHESPGNVEVLDKQ